MPPANGPTGFESSPLFADIRSLNAHTVDHPPRSSRRLPPMAPSVGGLQQVLRPLRPDGLARYHHTNDLGSLLRRLRTSPCLGRRERGTTGWFSPLHFSSQHDFHRTHLLSPGFVHERICSGPGIGRKLINAVYEQAKLAGIHRVYWHTQESNGTAMRLYDQVAERSGFVVYRKNIE